MFWACAKVGHLDEELFNAFATESMRLIGEYITQDASPPLRPRRAVGIVVA